MRLFEPISFVPLKGPLTWPFLFGPQSLPRRLGHLPALNFAVRQFQQRRDRRMYERLLIADRGVSLFQSRCGTNMVRSSARAAFVTLGDAQLRSRNFLDCDGGIWAAEGQPSGARPLNYLIREREFLREPAGS